MKKSLFAMLALLVLSTQVFAGPPIRILGKYGQNEGRIVSRGNGRFSVQDRYGRNAGRIEVRGGAMRSYDRYGRRK